MDFKKLAKYVIALGAAVLVVGLIVYLSNQPLHSGPGLGDLIKATIDSPENSEREATRTLALVVMGVGVVIAVSGLAVFFSAKKVGPDGSETEQPGRERGGGWSG